MVDRLARGLATLSELAEPMDMTLKAVTQHLRILEASGWCTLMNRGVRGIGVIGSVRLCIRHVARFHLDLLL